MAVPPVVPASTVVVTVRAAVAVTVMLRPPTRLAPSLTVADTVDGVRMLREIEAPTPTASLVPLALAFAAAVSASVLVAPTVTSPVGVRVTAPPTVAVVRFTTRFMANEPAMPTELALLAPEVEVADVVCVVSGVPVPTGVIPAVTLRPPTPSVAVPMTAVPVDAVLVIVTRLMATPAPTPTLALVFVSPFAVAVVSVLARDATVTDSPPTSTPSASTTEEVVLTMWMTIAPARLSEAPLSSEVEAFGVLVLPVVVPEGLLAACVSLAWVSWASDLSLTFELPPPDFCALASVSPSPAASASPLTVRDPVAARETAPPARILRPELAETMCVGMARTSEMPMPTLEPDTSPDAVDSTSPFCVAVTSMSPLVVNAGPASSTAWVVALEISTATVGLIATCPAAPPFAVVVRESSAAASTVRSLAPLSEAPRDGSPATPPRPAVVVSLTRLTATEAPIPTLAGASLTSSVCSVPVAAGSVFRSMAVPPELVDSW